MLKSFALFRRFFATKKYSKSHEWIELCPEKNVARIGISNYAQEQIGEIVHIDFPQIGKNVEADKSALVIESTKIAADVCTPVTGEVLNTNNQISKDPSQVNLNAQKEWLFEIKYEAEPLNLLTEEEYLLTLPN